MTTDLSDYPTILVMTIYAGSEKLVRMTEQMLAELEECIREVKLEGNIHFKVVAFNNDAERPVNSKLWWHAHSEQGNVGFGVGANILIDQCIFNAPASDAPEKITHVLVLNNDLQFPESRWLHELLKERERHYVLSPLTDRTATKAALDDHSRDLDPLRAHQVSAFCWLVPVATIKAIRRRFGFALFHPEFSNYGSDDVTGAILRRHLDPRPFKVVRRSWVRHLKAQTSKETGDRAGDPATLARMKSFFRTKGLR